jgi:Tetrapyrrole (Corrin/Porphyrin) Methylases
MCLVRPSSEDGGRPKCSHGFGTAPWRAGKLSPELTQSTSLCLRKPTNQPSYCSQVLPSIICSFFLPIAQSQLCTVMKNHRHFSLAAAVALAVASAFVPPGNPPRPNKKKNVLVGGPSSTGGLAAASASAAGSRSNNEWGIPHHSELPTLSPNAGRRPARILPNGGRLTLLGAGPGDPDLLTVAAYRLLTTAHKDDGNTVVIADRLVAPEILNLINCEVKVARKLPGCAELAQDEIYWWIYQGLRAGQHVIRLKIGDPFVFGRGGEEVLTCRTFGVEAQVIPVRPPLLSSRRMMLFLAMTMDPVCGVLV